MSKKHAGAKLMWAVRDPHGHLLMYSLHYWKSECIKLFLGIDVNPWRYFYRQGFRCVRVRVTEVRSKRKGGA